MSAEHTFPRSGKAPARAALAAALICAAAAPGEGRAEEPPRNLLEGRLVLGHPAALPTGLTTGLDLAYARGGWLAWGVRAGWSAATEYTATRAVRHDDVRMRLFGMLRLRRGRGDLGLRLALGATLVHEARRLSQGERAGLEGEALEITAWSVLPAADLEAVAAVRLLGGFGLTISGGPSLHLRDGEPRPGWSAGGGLFWQR